MFEKCRLLLLLLNFACINLFIDGSTLDQSLRGPLSFNNVVSPTNGTAPLFLLDKNLPQTLSLGTQVSPLGGFAGVLNFFKLHPYCGSASGIFVLMASACLVKWFFYNNSKDTSTIKKELEEVEKEEEVQRDMSYSLLPPELKEFASNMHYPLTREKIQWCLNFLIRQKRQALIDFNDLDAYSLGDEGALLEQIEQEMKEDDSKKVVEKLNSYFAAELRGEELTYNGSGTRPGAFFGAARQAVFTLVRINLGLRNLLTEDRRLRGCTGWLFWSSWNEGLAPTYRETGQYWSEILSKNNWKFSESKVQNIGSIPPLKKFLARFYKVHLMPKPDYMVDVIYALFALVKKGAIVKCLENFKIAVSFASRSHKKGEKEVRAPVIVLYIVPPCEEGQYKENAQAVVDELLEVTKPEWGSGRGPRYNKKINDLIFYAQGDGFYKAEESQGLKNVFEGPDYALYRPDWVDPENKMLDFNLKGAVE